MVKRNSRKIKLNFDSHLHYGSKEHFFHFFWGYLLPSINLIHSNKAKHSNVIYYFETCGPLMDNVVKEVIDLLSINAFIFNKKTSELIYDDMIIIPRWDIHLLSDYVLDINNDYGSHIKEFRTCPELVSLLKTPGFKRVFKSQVLQVKSIILQKIKASEDNLKSLNKPILMINRSQTPFYYSEKGSAEIKGYGTSRRGLKDVNQFVEICHKKGINIKTYEPGKHSLIHQIITFENSSGMISIKGAEFANLIWLNEKAKVILIKPSKMNTPAVQHKLAELLNLNFTEVVSEEGNHPSLLNINLFQFINEYSSHNQNI